MAKRKKESMLDPVKKAKRLARGIVGTVKTTRAILPKTSRKKPKHKANPLQAADSE